MKCEYMKEYPCNGVKPDLPDDVLVDVKLNLDPLNCGWTSCIIRVDRIAWNNHCLSFRIVDDRYKLAAETTWFGRGDNPPAGTHCEVKHDGEFVKCFVVGLDADGEGVVCKVEQKTEKGSEIDYIPHYQCTFRPLPNERDELVAAAESVIESNTSIPANSMYLEFLYDADMLKKPD